MAIYTKLDKFPGYNTLDRELRNAYHRELEINVRLGIDEDVIINFYGLPLSINDCSSMKTLRPKVSQYLAGLKTSYDQHKRERAKHPEKRFYVSEPGRKIREAVSIAYHEALLDIELALNAHYNWFNWIFIFRFNGNDYEFYPLNMNGYQKLNSTVK